MKRKFLFFVLTLLLISACQKSTVQFTADDDESTVNLKAGESFTVKLDGNPATGYEWALDTDSSSGVEPVGEPEYTSDSRAIGSGGKYVFTFKAKQSGKHTL